MFRVAIFDEFELAGAGLRNLLLLADRAEFQLIGTIVQNPELFIKENNIEVMFWLLHNADPPHLDALRQLIKKCPDTYFVAISPHTDFKTVRGVFRAGAYDYLAQPLSGSDISEVLDGLAQNYYRKYLNTAVIHKFDALIQHIFQGGGAEREFCAAIIDDIYDNAGLDAIARQITAQNAKEKIYLDMVYMKPWLEKFTHSAAFLVPPGRVVTGKKELLQVWDRDFSAVGRVVKKYQMLDDPLIYRIGKYVVVHIDERLSLDDLSKRLYMNKSYISHIFKKVSGMGLTDFQLDAKIDRAKILLHDEERKIAEIAEQIGYGNVEYFRKIFRDITGMSPSEYRAGVLQKSKQDA
ncbi:MAG: DNA-binding response regulator [Gracilibacteraceae bacterium]|jgi:two-component system response regulator YesN|nr:DNA-binding response regulator [Gracilibacteraceae bacterium]